MRGIFNFVENGLIMVAFSVKLVNAGMENEVEFIMTNFLQDV